MLRLDVNVDKDFADLYNRFNSTEKGKNYLKIMGIRRCNLDITDLSKLYFDNETDDDRTIDVNANIGSKTKSPNNYLGEITKGITKLNGIYLLWKKIRDDKDLETANNIISNLLKGDYYFHDLSGSGILVPYCFAWASNNVLSNGRQYGQLQSKPPKRSDSFIAVVIESIFDLSQEQMGAIAIPDFLINLAYFYNKEGLNLEDQNIKKKIINDLQRVIHSLNQQYRLSNQSAFTNFSIFDRPTLINTFKDFRYPDGTKPEDILEYVMKVQEFYVEFISKKDPTTNLPYRFPVNTLNIYITEDYKIEDEQFLELVCKYNNEGVFNIFICRGLAKLASCCRLLSDPIKLREYGRFDSFANAGLSLGSARVVTINFARLGKLSKGSKEEFFKLLNEKMYDTRNLLLSQRKIMEKKIQEGFLKFFNIGWMHMNMFFSTFGMNGLYECLQFMGIDIREEEGIEFAKQIFKFVETKLDEFSKEDKIPYNFEQVPAEGSSCTLARMDKLYFGDDYPYEIYANQFIPLWVKSDIIERAKIDGHLCQHMTGGSICHLNIGGEASEKQMRALIDLAISNGLEHFALNPNFMVCENEHVSLGASTQTSCPICNAPIKDSYTRVVGYFTKVSDWDKTRRNLDFPNRVYNYL